MDAPRVSVVVPTHRRRDSLARLLDALARQTLPPGEFEVVVAIDGSEDGTRELVEAHAAPFRLRWLWQPQRGRAAACNAGARLAAGALLVLLDDDMEPAPGWLAAHRAAHPPGSRRGVVGAAPIPVGPGSPPVVAFRAAGFRRKLERLAERGGSLRFNEVYTGNFSVPRDVFLEVGGFDEEFRLYGHEDYEMVLRMTRVGVDFRFDPAALARQHYGKSFRALAADILAEGETAVLFARKHPEVLADLHLAGYARRSPRTRRRLAALLALSRAWGGFPPLVIALVERLEPRRPAGLESWYRLVFDALYWLGVELALAADGVPRKVGFHEIEGVIAPPGAGRAPARPASSSR